MKDKVDILKGEVKISDVVMNATNETFAQILKESKQKENEKIQAMPVVRKHNRWKKRWIALIAVAALVVGTISAGAAGNFNWYNTIAEAMHISSSEEGLVEKYDLGGAPGIVAKDKGVTITVEQAIFDSRCYYVVMSIDGIKVPTEVNETISFESISFCGEPDGNHVDYSGSYYGIDQETGKTLYFWAGDRLEGAETLVIEVDEIYAAAFESDPNHEGLIQNELWRVDGHWKFEIPVEYGDFEMSFNMREVTGKSGAPLGDVSITPLSIECQTTYADGFYGFLMKDGSIKPANFGGGSMGSSTDEDFYGWEICHNYGTIVDLEQIEAILFMDITDDLEAIDFDNPIVDDFMVVPLPVIE